MLNVLVTGGTGFVGSALIDIVQWRRDVHLIVLDNLMSGDLSNLKLGSNVTVIEGDIRNSELLKEIARSIRVDVVAHLAGVVGAPACDLDDDLAYNINVIGTWKVIDAFNDKPIINISSTSVYGDKTGELVTEESEPAPLTSYGSHKFTAERLISKYAKRYITFRPATAFGTSQRIRVDLLPNTLAYKALHEKVLDIFQPEVIRPFIHVIDFARAVLYAAEDNMPWNNVYNLGKPDLTVTKGQLAQWLCQMAGAKYIERAGEDPDMRNYDVSFDKIIKTGFEFHGDFNTGYYDILNAHDKIAADYGRYNTVYLTQQFINKEKGNV